MTTAESSAPSTRPAQAQRGAEASLPPGPPAVGRNPISLLRYLRALNKDPIAFQAGRFNTYGDTYTSRVGTIPTVVTREAAFIQRVLVEDAASYRKPTTGIGAAQLTRLLGNGLLSSNGELWRQQRRQVQPAFHARAMQENCATMVELTRTWAKHIGQRGQVDIAAELTQLTLRIVARVLLGIHLKSEGEEVTHLLDEFRQAVGGVSAVLPKWVPYPPRNRQNQAIARTHAMMDRFIDAHLHLGKLPQGTSSASLSAESSLLETLCRQLGSPGSMSRQLLRSEALTLFFAGHETTTHALSWTIALLGRHPEVEIKLRQEVERVLGDRPATYSDVEQLSYTGQVLAEALRLYPPAYSLVREACRDATLGDFLVPEGAHVLLATYHVQRSEKHFPDPTQFRPERFDSHSGAPVPGSYLPFGAGSRACIGKRFALVEATLILATVQQLLTIRPLRRELPACDAGITLAPKGGVEVVARPRPRIDARQSCGALA